MTSASTGALPIANPGNTITLHFVTGYVTANVAANTLLLVDRLFTVAKTMNSIKADAVGGALTRYQNAVAKAADNVGGNCVLRSTISPLPTNAGWCANTPCTAASRH